ncbi:MAG: hypothetical protein MI923_16095 [Phycisphaerales bacterium]|nr:hypothetical protein [Phycisphaerales bacterium]
MSASQDTTTAPKARFDFNCSRYELPEGMIEKQIVSTSDLCYRVSNAGYVHAHTDRTTVVLLNSKGEMTPDEARAIAFGLLTCADLCEAE